MDTNTSTEHENENPVTELTPKELVMIAAVRDGDNRLANVLMEQMSPPSWTYERRLALHLIGVMGLEYPGLHESLFTNGDSPSALHDTIDALADALIDGMHTLGCPHDLTLAQILDRASSFPTEGDAS